VKAGSAERHPAAVDPPELRGDYSESFRAPASLIGITVVMKGTLTVGEDLIIEGSFDGSITDASDDTVVVRRTAKLRGEVSAGHVQVEDGTNLEGTVLSGRISLADS
jgi:cytoskeletal protein CcmA (bactofilin family)